MPPAKHGRNPAMVAAVAEVRVRNFRGALRVGECALQLQDVFDGAGANIGSSVIVPEDNAPRDNSSSRTPSLNMMLKTDARHFKKTSERIVRNNDPM